MSNKEEIDKPLAYFAEVIVPVPIPGTYTYRLPAELIDVVQIGWRVVVEFGRRKVYTGVIADIHHKPPKKGNAKYIMGSMGNAPIIKPVQLNFWKWVANYYLSTLGETMQVALPSGLKLSSQSRIQINPLAELPKDLKPKEEVLIEALKGQESILYSDLPDILGINNPYPILKGLVEKEAIILFEELKDKFSPKKIKKVRLAKDIANSNESLQSIFEGLSKKPKQEAILLNYIAEVKLYQAPENNSKGVSKKTVLKAPNGEEYSKSSLSTLIKNGIFEEFEEIISRLGEIGDPLALDTNIQLSPTQDEALNEINSHFQEKDTVLLHGITGSGKTEIYIQLITEALNSGGQVLLMLPEIAITTQIVSRFKKHFGNNFGVYHSKYSDNERVEVWNGVLEGNIPFVIGVRSSIFLPFDNLSLIIVDEEHENSYKQYDPSPRYYAKDAALVLSRLHKAKVLLGTATPSLESYYLAKTGKYGFVEIKERYGEAVLPKIELVNTLYARKHKQMSGEFSKQMIEAIQNRLDANEQIILFQNRRGFSPHLACDHCNWIPMCKHCSVSLTYHLYRNELRCHYCGHKEAVPKSCIKCDSTEIKTVGVGTEKIEDEIKVLFPTARVARMDLDTTRSKYSYQQFINDFESRQIDILVGTQMVTKGLDFRNVTLVGVFDTDRLLYFPDFRSYERAFQLITQVSGRAGRAKKQGEVLIQTNNPEDWIFDSIVKNDYISFFKREIRERKKFLYPPFSRIIKVTVKAETPEFRTSSSEKLAVLLKHKLGAKRILGPEIPSIDKIRDKYIATIYIKIEREIKDLRKAKDIIRSSIQTFLDIRENRKAFIVLDVDTFS